jgi:GDP-4-dehydro-6-deoxy-D-mannose reductase
VSASVLVTGASGFIGAHLVAALAARGDAAWALSRRPGGAAAGTRSLAGDVRDEAALAEAIRRARPDLVVHLAGAKVGALDELEAVNVLGTERVVACVARERRGARVVVVGSAAEYGAVSASALPIREDAPLAPVGDYGRTKAAATALALAIGAREGVAVAVARVFNVTGPGEPESLVFGRIASAIAAAEASVYAPGPAPAEVPVGPLGATRDLIDVRDVARALLAIAERAEPGTIVNVGRGVEERVRDHATRLAARARVAVRLAEPPAAEPLPPARHVADVARLTALGFRTAIPLDRSAADLLDDARARRRSARAR